MKSTSRTRTRLVLLFVSVLLVAGCPEFSEVNGSGHAATDKRLVGAFSAISIHGAADVEVSIGPVQSVEVTIDDNLLPLIETKVDADTLWIKSTKNYNTGLGLKIKIVAPSLAVFDGDGAVNLHASGFDGKVFSLLIYGACNADLQGQVDSLHVRASGAAKIRAFDLAAKQVKLDISGAGDAQVTASESLDATVSGAGDVRYRGHPAQVSQNVSGAGSVKAE